jgi:hypothetical protein
MSRRKIIEPPEFVIAEPLVKLQRLEGERVEVVDQICQLNPGTDLIHWPPSPIRQRLPVEEAT